MRKSSLPLSRDAHFSDAALLDQAVLLSLALHCAQQLSDHQAPGLIQLLQALNCPAQADAEHSCIPSPWQPEIPCAFARRSFFVFSWSRWFCLFSLFSISSFLLLS
jgi:hypothetical protein